MLCIQPGDHQENWRLLGADRLTLADADHAGQAAEPVLQSCYMLWLTGQRVVVTRAVHQAAELTEAFKAVGAQVAQLPLIELAPARDSRALRQAAREAAHFDWLVLTSANAVDAFLPETALASKALASSTPRPACAVVGPATASALRRYELEPTLEARRSQAEGLLEALVPRLRPGSRVLVPQAEDARPVLLDGLRAAGAEVVSVVAYRKRLPRSAAPDAQRLFADSLGWVTCTSPRIVRHLAQLLGADWPRRRAELRAISIGPVTSAELRRLGVEPAAEAERPSNQELVDAAVGAARRLASTTPNAPAAPTPG